MENYIHKKEPHIAWGLESVSDILILAIIIIIHFTIFAIKIKRGYTTKKGVGLSSQISVGHRSSTTEKRGGEYECRSS